MEANYSSAERAVIIRFSEDFANAEKILGLPGVRRALIAYWAEALADLRERRTMSVFTRYHSYDAVSELIAYRHATENIFRAVAKETTAARYLRGFETISIILPSSSSGALVFAVS